MKTVESDVKEWVQAIEKVQKESRKGSSAENETRFTNALKSQKKNGKKKIQSSRVVEES